MRIVLTLDEQSFAGTSRSEVDSTGPNVDDCVVTWGHVFCWWHSGWKDIPLGGEKCGELSTHAQRLTTDTLEGIEWDAAVDD